VIPTLLTVFIAGLLGGAIALEVTAIVVIAGVALVLIAIANGGRNFAKLCDLSRD